MAATLSVILPTKGRLSLSAAVASVVEQLDLGDELLIVGDGLQPYARGLCALTREMPHRDVVYGHIEDPTSVFGNAQRDFAVKVAKGTHLCFLDDDDVYRDEALDLFRSVASDQPDMVHVFRAEWGPGHHAHGTILWKEPLWRSGNVGTPMVVYPNRKPMPAFMDFNDAGIVSDFGWMTAALADQTVMWHSELVATVRP